MYTFVINPRHLREDAYDDYLRILKQQVLRAILLRTMRISFLVRDLGVQQPDIHVLNTDDFTGEDPYVLSDKLLGNMESDLNNAILKAKIVLDDHTSLEADLSNSKIVSYGLVQLKEQHHEGLSIFRLFRDVDLIEILEWCYKQQKR